MRSRHASRCHHHFLPPLTASDSGKRWLLCSIPAAEGCCRRTNSTLRLPCYDKRCSNEQERIQSIAPFFLFFSAFEAGLCVQARRGRAAAAASKASHHQQVGASARDKAIDSEEGPSHFLWLLDQMCCINANPITPRAWSNAEAFLGECKV